MHWPNSVPLVIWNNLPFCLYLSTFPPPLSLSHLLLFLSLSSLCQNLFQDKSATCTDPVYLLVIVIGLSVYPLSFSHLLYFPLFHRNAKTFFWTKINLKESVFCTLRNKLQFGLSNSATLLHPFPSTISKFLKNFFSSVLIKTVSGHDFLISLSHTYTHPLRSRYSHLQG